MGCDIHMYVEYKKTVNNKEEWISGDYFKHNPYHDGEDESEKAFEKIELHGNRNYQLFTTLAGVRDYTEQVVPVSDPKGVPEDACEYVQKQNKEWGSDGHSHSWLTLKELRDYQSKKPVMNFTGLLSPSDVIAFDTAGTLPQSWCQGTNQEGYERRWWSEDNKELVPLIDKMQERAKELMQYEWQEYDLTNDEKIRIVFWFDN